MDEQFLYDQARQIADFIMETAGEKAMDDRRKESVNPYRNQTEEGLFLEMYYSLPATLYTPWGSWGFGGSGHVSSGATERILQALGATVHTPKKVTKMGEFGPVYAIHKFQDVTLPEPKERQRDQYMSYEDANAAWKRLSGK